MAFPELGDLESSDNPLPSERFKVQNNRVGVLYSFHNDGRLDGPIDFLEPPHRWPAGPFTHANDSLVEAQVFKSGEERGDRPTLELVLVSKSES